MAVLPSPQSIVYSPPAGIVTDSPGAATTHDVTKSESSGTSCTVTEAVSVVDAVPSVTLSVNVMGVSALTWGAVNVVERAVSLERLMPNPGWSWVHR